jgi:hypothetical protein
MTNPKETAMRFLMKTTIEQAYSIDTPNRTAADKIAEITRNHEAETWRSAHDGAEPKVTVEIIEIGDDADLGPVVSTGELRLAEWYRRRPVVLRLCKSPWHAPECPGNLGPQCQDPNDI